MRIGDRRRDRRRVLVWTFLLVAAIAFVLGWWARAWTRPSPESKAREAAEQIRERVREMTH